MFTASTTVKLADTDAAGVAFFTSPFRMAHDAYEALMTSLGLPVALILARKTYALPIVHAEADYLKPLPPGEQVSIEVSVQDIGDSSFRLSYLLKRSDGAIAAALQTTHVVIDKDTQETNPLPEDLRNGLQALML